MTEPNDDDFDAPVVVRPMRFRFSADVQWREIPEPSTKAVMRFFEEWLSLDTEIVARSKIEPPPTNEDGTLADEMPEARATRIAGNLTRQAAVAVEMKDQRIQLAAAVCSGMPAVDELAALNHRVCEAFFGYLQGKLSPQT